MHPSTVLNTIRESWGWAGLVPESIIASNLFGNVIVRASDGSHWRICPEELSCERIARDDREYATLWSSEGFQLDWQMTRFVQLAEAKLGPVAEDGCYCLVHPAVIGGAYDADNFATNSRQELLACSGDLARQIKNLPDGTWVRLVPGK